MGAIPRADPRILGFTDRFARRSHRDILDPQMLKSLLAVPLIVGASVVAIAQAPTLADRIGYATTAPQDAVAALQQRLDAGQARLAFDPAHGYLPAVLDALRVPRSS